MSPIVATTYHLLVEVTTYASAGGSVDPPVEDWSADDLADAVKGEAVDAQIIDVVEIISGCPTCGGTFATGAEHCCPVSPVGSGPREESET